MTLNTKIEWTDHTWNPWIGCTPVSEGCDNCYARKWNERYFKDKLFSNIRPTKQMNFPLSKKVKSGDKVFVCSLSDFFHPDVSLELFDCAIRIMLKRSDVTFILLTKRPENIDKSFYGQPLCGGGLSPDEGFVLAHYYCRVLNNDVPFPQNIWLGFTAENQERFNERIKVFNQQQSVKECAVKFVSVEPMLDYLFQPLFIGDKITNYGLDWVIVGGETGTGSRPMPIDGARHLRDQCRHDDVPLFFKKVGRGIETPDDLKVYQFPKGHNK